MPSSWLCCFLPLAGMLLLGQPAQGMSFRSPPDPSAAGESGSQSVWAKQRDLILKQVLRAQEHVLKHMNKKHNDTFYMAPKETTKVMMQTALGQIYYVNTMLVKAKCPDNYTDDLYAHSAKDCEILPESPKLKCSFTVIELYSTNSYIIDEEDCHEHNPPPANPDNSADSADPPKQGEDDQGSPYV